MVFDKSQAIQVAGLLEFKRELKAIDASFPKELRKAGKAAADVVAADTKASFSQRGGVAPKVAESVKALAGQTSAAVRIGGDAFPYALGSEFGSVQYTQFPAWRGSSGGAGYSLFPTIREDRQKILEIYGQGVDAVTAKAFPN